MEPERSPLPDRMTMVSVSNACTETPVPGSPRAMWVHGSLSVLSMPSRATARSSSNARGFDFGSVGNERRVPRRGVAGETGMQIADQVPQFRGGNHGRELIALGLRRFR